MLTGNKILDFLMNITSIKGVALFVAVYIFILLILIIVWVYKDITNRTINKLAIFSSIILILVFGPVGFLLYILVRPGKTIFEQANEEVERNLELLMLDVIEKVGKKNVKIRICPKCKKEILKGFKKCPYCKTKIGKK